jgi:hypothetical protein
MQIKRERFWLEGYFFKFRKACIADIITLLSSSVQNSEGSGDSDSGDICAVYDDNVKWWRKLPNHSLHS